MSDPIVRLDPYRLSVEPGAQALATVTVTNQSTIVEGFRLRVIDVAGGLPSGGPAAWSSITPDEIPIYPKQTGTAVVRFTPPAERSVASGTFPFAIQVASSVDASVSAAAEGEIEVGKVFGLQAKLTPVTSFGRWRGLHTIQVSNWGNTAARLRLVPSDPDDLLGFLVHPDVIDVPLGATATARIKVRTRKPFLRGTPVRRPFQIAAEPDPPDKATGPAANHSGPRRPVLDGALSQKPILSRGMVAIAVVAVAAAAVGTFLATKADHKNQTFKNDGPPSQPKLAAAAMTDGTVLLSWSAIHDVQSYKLFTIDPVSRKIANTTTVDGTDEEHRTGVLTPNTAYCFALQSTRGTLNSPRSSVVCVKTPAPKSSESGPASAGGPSRGSASSSAPGSLQTTSHIAIVGSPYTSKNGGASAAANAKTAFALKGYNTNILDTAKYPHLYLVGTATHRLPPGRYWLVYLGPFPTSDAALASCHSNQSTFGVCIDAMPLGNNVAPVSSSASSTGSR